MRAADPAIERITIGLDRFPMLAVSPLANAHEWITRLLSEVLGTAGRRSYDLAHYAAGRDILGLDAASRTPVLLAAAERRLQALTSSMPIYPHRQAAIHIAEAILPLDAELDRDSLFDLLLHHSSFPVPAPLTEVALPDQLREGERYILHRYRALSIQSAPMGDVSDNTARLTRLIGDGARFFLVPGEYWSDAVNADLAAQPDATAWTALLRHLLTATSARPSSKWLGAAAAHMRAVGEADIQYRMERWLSLMPKGGHLVKVPGFLTDVRWTVDRIHDDNATVLRGLLWLTPLLPDGGSLLPLVVSVALAAYRKVPGTGPRAIKVGHSAVYALSEFNSLQSAGLLGVLKTRVAFAPARKEIEKAFDATAAALQLPREEVEAMAVPDCGIPQNGPFEEMLGEYRAELSVAGTGAILSWFGPAGGKLTSVPATVRRQYPEEVKELQRRRKEVADMLSAQRDRIETLLLTRKSWPADVWRERYLDHPLVGTLVRRIIWCVDGVGAVFSGNEASDVEGCPYEVPARATITFWHPMGRFADEVTAWRRRIETLEIVQPFKQAHREIYPLTEAERETGIYSNRFAGHILRQHPFHALCQVRGWKDHLRLMVDTGLTPTSRELPEWGLRAEFRVEPVGIDYGIDTTDAAVFLHLATDQVRFFRMGEDAPLPLAEVPALVFSEVMRDVDLFISVASIGNDPTWQDSGPDGRYIGYWNHYSFGELSASAVTRREVVERLLPRLKIAEQCSVEGRFLIVRGRRRTYKVHLGSGSILMKPNDQHLCIVPDSPTPSPSAQVYLPFEGDRMLSIILSKAFLLADDKGIRDPSINAQIDEKR